jgi:N-methylhydantoinase A
MLFADFRYDLTDTLALALEEVDLAELERRFAQLERAGARQIEDAGIGFESLRYTRYAEMRYQRQEHTVKVRLPSGPCDKSELRRLFEETYGRRYGHVSRDMGIDLIMLRVVVDARTTRPRETPPAGPAGKAARATQRPVWFDEQGLAACDVWQRGDLAAGSGVRGPAVIEEEASTTVLAPGDTARIDGSGNIVIRLAHT